ncbi:uncharacterized protein [Typha angustifolia]|uniref:uncharacterized protein isoform X1 n=1 Tax=Typha angustifolia TaxID=59011 RepID=UPI003C2D006E
MDLDTENRLAALLLEEARRLRAQADQEGVHVYLQQPNVRCRPNSRFLTATVLGVQQANRAVEVSEMWHAREKELELEHKLKNRSKDRHECRSESCHSDSRKRSSKSGLERKHKDSSDSRSLSKLDHESYSDEDGGLKDEEIEEFLQSRAKRGRGAIGSRMDEAGPYPSSSLHHNVDLVPSSDVRVKEEWEHRVLGPEKPESMKSKSLGVACREKSTLDDASTSRRHRSKDKREEKKSSGKTKRKEKRSKHHHRSRHRK